MSFLDLVTSENEIPGVNEGFSNYKWMQVSATRDVTTTNFPNGLIRFKFDVDATKRWIPSEAYIRMRIKLTNSAGTQLKLSDDIAPNMGFISSMFQNMEFRYNNVAISTLSDYVPEVNSLIIRTHESKSVIDSLGGLNMWEYDFYSRQQRVCLDGLDKNDYVDADAIVTLAALGIDALNTIDVSAAGLVTWAAGGGVAPNVRNIFQVGDVLALTGTGAGNTIKYGTVKSCPTTLTMQLNETQTASTAASVLAAISLTRRAPRISKRDTGIEVLWKPPLSIFNYEKALPIGKYELQMNPQTSSVYKNLIIESLNTTTRVAPTHFDVSIGSMYLYVPTVKAKRFGSGKFFIDLTEITCQKDTVTGSGFTHSRFTVPKSTFALTAAFQDSRSQTHTLYPTTKFKVGVADSELNLTRFHIDYAGQTRPSPDSDPIYKAEATFPEEYTAEMYYRSQVATGGTNDTGGAEKLREWQDRGAYYHYFWPRDGSNSDTEVRVHYQFSSLSNADCLLFSWAKKLVEVNVSDDNITSVNVNVG